MTGDLLPAGDLRHGTTAGYSVHHYPCPRCVLAREQEDRRQAREDLRDAVRRTRSRDPDDRPDIRDVIP